MLTNTDIIMLRLSKKNCKVVAFNLSVLIQLLNVPN